MRILAAFLCLAVTASTASASPSSACSGRRTGWMGPSDGTPDHVAINWISIPRERELRWHGKRIDRARLRYYLGIVATMRPLPFTILRPGPGVDCAFLEAIRDDMEAKLPCAQGLCGEGRGRWSDDVPLMHPSREDEIEPIIQDMANSVADAESAANAALAKPER